MSVSVIAKHDLDGYILDTEIVVKIPQGTAGKLVQSVRNDIVIVQFNVPSLGALRVSRHDLIVNDTIDSVLTEAERIINIKPFVEADVHRALDNILVRALEVIATDSNRKQVKQLITLYNGVQKHYGYVANKTES
ncbi:MAG: hypothetical protein AAF846_24650 [Chloroflexota bacterium]